MAPCCECWGSGAQTAAAAHRVTDWKKLILRSNNNAGVVPRGGGVEWVGARPPAPSRARDQNTAPGRGEAVWDGGSVNRLLPVV
ncbi:unnamed protein product [Boreogadus saida]